MPMDLEPERLGRAGERQFESLCELGGLYCNKSVLDATGWDFVVEFPMPALGPGMTLDKRRPDACVVQLKSTAGRGNHRIRLKLSAVDRLAKDPRPALIIVFRMRRDGTLIGGTLIHLIGQELAYVLKRLREAQERDRLDINHVEISYDYERAGRNFGPTPDELVAAIRSACGEDSAAYVERKQWELDALGYEDGHFVANALVWVDGPEHLSDMLLGLRPLKPDRIEAWDRRFDILIPYNGTYFDDIEEFTLMPPTLGTCTVSMLGNGLSKAAIFAAEIFVGPPLPQADGPYLLIRHPDFILKFRSSGLQFETVGTFAEARRTVPEWAELVRGLSNLSAGTGRIRISGNARLPDITVNVQDPLDGPYLEDLPTLATFLDGWVELLAMSGQIATESVTINEIWDANEAHGAVDILLNPKTAARLEFQDSREPDGPTAMETLFFRSCTFAGNTITFSLKAMFERTADPIWRYRSTHLEPVDVSAAVEDLEEYAATHAERAGLTVLLDPRNFADVNQRDLGARVSGESGPADAE